MENHGLLKIYLFRQQIEAKLVKITLREPRIGEKLKFISFFHYD